MIRTADVARKLGRSILLLAVSITPVPASAAERAANLLGHVRAFETGTSIGGARVVLETNNTVSITNALGYFTFTNLPTGVHFLTVEADGFEPRRMQVRLIEDESYETEILLGPAAVQLEGLTVSVMPRKTFSDLEGLARRIDRGFGQFILRDEMQARGGNLITLLQSQAGVQVGGAGGGTMAGRTVVLRRAAHLTSSGVGQERIEACYPAIFVDGRRFSRRASLGDQPTDLTEFLAQDMEAVEVYSGSSVPAVFGGGDAACGAILIWMRRGPPRRPGNG